MSYDPNDANSILMGGGAPAVKFEQVGAQVTGTVVEEPRSEQQKDFRTKVPETWKDGSPKMQVVVRLATNLRDPEKLEDDGERNLYIKGKELTNAVRNAVRQSGAKGIHTGGTLTVAFVGEGPTEPGFNPPKLYAAQYVPPVVSFAGTTAPVSPAPQQAYTQQPVPQMQQTYVPAPAQPTGLLPTAVGGTPPPGVDPGMWSRLTPEQRAAVAAVSAAPAGVAPPF